MGALVHSDVVQAVGKCPGFGCDGRGYLHCRPTSVMRRPDVGCVGEGCSADEADGIGGCPTGVARWDGECWVCICFHCWILL